VGNDLDTEAGVSRELDADGVLTVTLDDGDKNALTPEVFEALIAALDADTGARAVVVTGRPGILTAGLDIKWMAANGREGVEHLLVRFGECLMRWWTDPRPTVCAATGHAIAAGTMLAMACDHAVADREGFWGLTETRIDFEIPDFGLALARANMRNDRLEDLLLPGERITAAQAVEAGFADVVVAPDEVLDAAHRHARELAALPGRAYAGTKTRLRGQTADAVLDGLRADIALLTAHLG
jgi:enoyl-CoA hydratase